MAQLWEYERGEHRTKHCWSNDEAGFESSRKGPIGKCPSSITDVEAKQLLNSGIPFFRDEAHAPDACPDLIFNVRDGVPYEAAPTMPGVSFHGYPWRGRMPPRSIMRQLQTRAETQGRLREFTRWVREYKDQ